MSDDLTNDDVIKALRDFQESAFSDREPMSFVEWQANGGLARDTEAYNKAKGNYGANGLGQYNPGIGMMGPPGNTASFAPTGPRNRRSGNQAVGFGGDHGPKGSGLRTPPNKQPYDKPDFSSQPWFGTQQFGVQAGVARGYPSKYTNDRPNQPPPWIDDVNMESIWYSPFEPVWPFGPPYYDRPREWNFPVGYNLNYVPARLQTIGALRGMRQSWGVLATIIETRKDQLLRLPWTIQRKDKPRASSKGVDELRQFFRRPDGKLTFNQWSHKLLDDLFVIDAPSLYISRNLGGRPKDIEVIDGGTIFPLIDDAGRRPDTTYDIGSNGQIEYIHRQPAFQQIIYGLPMINLSEDELIYAMMRPRPELPVFGYSPVEQMLSETTEAIRKTFYQLEFWRAGSMPELIVTVPDAWNPRQIAMFQGHFDALLSGQLSLKSKVRFVPGGMKPFDIKNASGQSLWSDRDELLVRLACYAFSVSPTPFVKQVNRGTAANATQSAQEEGLYPLMSWWKDDIMDTIIQEKFGYDDIEFVFQPRPEVDLEKQAKIHQVKLQIGEMTLDEARAESGMEPYANGLGAIPLVYFGSGAVKLEQIVDGTAMLPGAAVPAEVGTGQQSSAPKPENITTSGPAKPTEGGTGGSKDKPTPVHKLNKILLNPDFQQALIKLVAKDKHDIKSAANEANINPTKRQKKIGNYKKGHLRVQGLNITIENPKGSERSEKDRHGRSWEVKMPAPYGYILGTIGADDMHMDCYIGNHPESDIVYVIDQDKVDPDGTPKGFDEHKCMIGFINSNKAIKVYLKSHFDGFANVRCVAVTEISMKDFKSWLKDGDMKKPINEQGVGEVIGRRGIKGGITKVDGSGIASTISSSTNLLPYDQTVPVKRRKKMRLEAFDGSIL